eukprot:scaffold22778_cov166-Cylindrotheca_fusiformis.AAC.3
MDFYDDYSRSAPWEMVTRKVVDPVTFSCFATVEYLPRLEECSYETTGPAHVEPRFGYVYQRSTSRGIDAPTWTPPSSRTPVPTQRKSSNNNSNNNKGNKPSSLGAFFNKTSKENTQDTDNMSLGSRSMNSRSIADRSTAERSKSEDKLKRKAKERKGKERRNSKNNMNVNHSDMVSILEDSATSLDEENAKPQESTSSPVRSPPTRIKPLRSSLRKPKLGKCAESNEDDDDDVSLNLEQAVEDRHLRFQEGHQEFEIPRLTNSMYDDCFYGSEELADFRYEAFLEEAGLDVDEYIFVEREILRIVCTCPKSVATDAVQTGERVTAVYVQLCTESSRSCISSCVCKESKEANSAIITNGFGPFAALNHHRSQKHNSNDYTQITITATAAEE